MQTLKKVKTNNVPRFLSYFHELPKAVRAEFGRKKKDSTFFSYRGNWYCMDDFLSLRNPFHCPWGQTEFPGWDGYDGSGMILKYAKDENGHEDPERVIIGTY